MKALFKSFKNHPILAFIPWIFFMSTYGNAPGKLVLASGGSLILMILLNFKELKNGFILPWGSLIVFAFLLANEKFIHIQLDEIVVFRIINSGLAVVVCFSMLVGKPFTLQYAREKADRKIWNNPHFIKINWVLTGVWALLLIIMAIPSYILTIDQIRASWFWNYGLSIFCIMAGAHLNKKIPVWFTKK